MNADLRDRIETKLRERICSVCVEAVDEETCGLPAGESCPLFAHLDKIIEIVRSIEGASTDPYVGQIRQIVCPDCRMDTAGRCAFRDDLDCALDLYLPLIIEEIETELASTE